MENMWQIPYICQFVKLFRGSLNMDLITPEELEQALCAPETSGLCSELFTKLLLKKGASRRDLPPGEGYSFEKWHALLAKQITQWQNIYERYEKTGRLDKFSAAQRIIISMFEELEGNPFMAPVPSEETKRTETLVTPNEGTRETRSKTNSLPRSRKLKYTDEYEHSDDLDDEEKIRGLHEIQDTHRAVVLYYLCTYKMEIDEELVHELNFVPLDEQRIQPIGKDTEGSFYYYFNNFDCRVYKESSKNWSLVARTLDEVRELIIRLEQGGSFELARMINGMWPELQKNEQERSKRALTNIRKVQIPATRRGPELDNDDSDFSPVEDEYHIERRGPGRPRKFQIPERKPKIMPETNGDNLILTGILKKLMTNTETVHSFEGMWSMASKREGRFKFIKAFGSEANGIYSGCWDFNNKIVEETLDLVLTEQLVSGFGENMFGIFSLEGIRDYELPAPQIGEVLLGKLQIKRSYLKLEVNDDSSCSEADPEEFDDVKPLHKLEFEEKVHLEHMKMPLKSIRDLKKSLKAQEKRELKRLPFYRSEFLTF